MNISEKHLIWIDLEMTGLDTDNDEIIEIATIMTDENLNILAEGPVLAIHQPDEVLNKMDSWNRKTHQESGLNARVKASDITLEQAEQQTLDFLAQYVPAGKSPMCGNSICQDRRFLHRQMPTLAAYFHYRNFDVSSFKIAAQRWAPDIADAIKKQSSHLALDDIRDSIAEMVHYRRSLLKI